MEPERPDKREASDRKAVPGGRPKQKPNTVSASQGDDNPDFVPKKAGASGQRPSQPKPTPGPAPSRRESRWKLKAGVACAIVVGLMIWLKPLGTPTVSNETRSPNWPNVEEAQKATASGHREALKAVDKSGVGQIVNSIGISVQDLNSALTTTVQQHLRNGDMKSAQAALVGAQNIPPIPAKAKDASGHPIQSVQPTITPGMAAGIRDGNTKFFQIFLYDSCDEDGDVVEVLLNGAAFATVPLTHAGATLSVPITPGSSTDISLRGIFDGGGGITTACKTSLGDFFSRTMAVGEVCSVGLVQK